MNKGKTAASMHRMKIVVASADAATGRNVSMSCEVSSAPGYPE
jgi:hypothetical protein